MPLRPEPGPWLQAGHSGGAYRPSGQCGRRYETGQGRTGGYTGPLLSGGQTDGQGRTAGKGGKGTEGGGEIRRGLPACGGRRLSGTAEGMRRRPHRLLLPFLLSAGRDIRAQALHIHSGHQGHIPLRQGMVREAGFLPFERLARALRRQRPCPRNRRLRPSQGSGPGATDHSRDGISR